METQPLTEITVRMLNEMDEAEVRRIAERDSARVPSLPLLGAEREGRLIATLSPRDASVTADPFEPTAEAVGVLRARARTGRHGRRLRRASGRRQWRSSGAMVRPAEESCSQ
jgi:hypothetical protein